MGRGLSFAAIASLNGRLLGTVETFRDVFRQLLDWRLRSIRDRTDSPW
jgi:hypothetical protein